MSKGHAGGSNNKGRYHPYERQDKRPVNRDSRSEKPAWKTIGMKQFKRGQGRTTTTQPQGYKDPPVPRRLVGESHIPPGLSSTYSESGENMSKIRLAGEFGKVRAGSKAGLRFVGYQFDLRAGRVRLTPDRWQNLQDKILEIMSLPHCPV